MLTDTPATVACPHCGSATASPLHSLADWRRTGATLCERCGAGCVTRADWSYIRIALLDHRHWRLEWPAWWWGSRPATDQRYNGNVSISINGHPPITAPAISGVATFPADPEFATEYPGVFVEATGTRFEPDPALGGMPAPLRAAQFCREWVSFGYREVLWLPATHPACSMGGGDERQRAVEQDGIAGERVPQAADAGVCEHCWQDGKRIHPGCALCHGSGRIDGRRGAGEDYACGMDGWDAEEIYNDDDCEWQRTQRVGDGWTAFGLSRSGELHRRASRDHSYTGAPGNHAATLPAGRLVLDARKRRIGRAAQIHASAFAADAPRDVAARMAQQSPDLPRAHVGDHA